MFSSLGNSFLETVKKPQNMIYMYLVFIVLFNLYELIYEYTAEYFVADSQVGLLSQILYYLKNHYWIVIIYLAFFLLCLFLVSLMISYVVNKRLKSQSSFSGTSKIFGFSIFLGLVYLVPAYLFGMLKPSVYLSLLLVLLFFFYFLYLYPVLFMVPILLVNNDLKSSLQKSYDFAKKNYGWLIVIQILLSLVLMALGQLFLLSMNYLAEYSIFIWLFLITVLFLWGVNFAYSWYNASKN